MTAPIVLGDELVARLWMSGSVAGLGPLDRRAIEHAAVVCALELLRQRTALEVEWRLRGDVLSDLLAGGASPALGRGRSRWGTTSPARTRCWWSRPTVPERSRWADRATCGGRSSRAGATTSRRSGSHAGPWISPSCAARVYGLLLQLEDPHELVRFADEVLAPLRRYDERKDMSLVTTLCTYLEQGMSTGRAAAALYLHPNTVGLRLRRIEELIGVRLAEPEALLQVNAALMAEDVAGTTWGSSPPAPPLRP